jgi:hypothetical protein
MTDPARPGLPDDEGVPPETAVSMTVETSAVMDPADDDPPERPAGDAAPEPARVPDRPVARPAAGPRAPRPTSTARPTVTGRPVSGGPQGAGLAGRPTSGAGVGSRPTSGAGAGARSGDDREAERGLRGLVGSGSSQVSVTAALRARDAARPTEQDLADAEERLVIVRRNWLPREDLPRR